MTDLKRNWIHSKGKMFNALRLQLLNLLGKNDPKFMDDGLRVHKHLTATNKSYFLFPKRGKGKFFLRFKIS